MDSISESILDLILDWTVLCTELSRPSVIDCFQSCAKDSSAYMAVFKT